MTLLITFLKLFNQTRIHNKVKWGEYIVPSLLLTICLFGFIPNPYIDIRLSKQIISEWAAFIFGVSFFLRNKWLKVFLVCVFARYIFMFLFPIYDLRTSVICIRAAYGTLTTLLIYAIFYEGLCTAVIRKEVIYNLLSILAILQSLFMILQFFGIWILFAPVCTGISGLLSNPNMAGSFLALTTPCFFRRNVVWLYPIVACGLIFSQCEGAMIPVVLVFLTYVYFKLPKNVRLSYIIVTSGIVSIVCVFAFFHFSFRSMEIRFMLWHHAIKGMFFNLPLVGYGPGQFKILFPRIFKYTFGELFTNGVPIQAHNEYIQALVEFGILGCTAIALFLSRIIRKGIRSGAWIAVAGVGIALINSSVNFLFHTVVCVIVLIYFSIIEKESVK